MRIFSISSFSNITEDTRLSTTSFEWRKYTGVIGFEPTMVWNSVKKIPTIGFTFLGWTYTKDLIVRQRPEGLAIMLKCDDTDEEFWFHDYD